MAVRVSAWVWPAWVEIVAGGLGIAFALWSIDRRRQGKSMHPDAAKADVGLLALSALLVLIGAVRWFQA